MVKIAVDKVKKRKERKKQNKKREEEEKNNEERNKEVYCPITFLNSTRKSK